MKPKEPGQKHWGNELTFLCLWNGAGHVPSLRELRKEPLKSDKEGEGGNEETMPRGSKSQKTKQNNEQQNVTFNAESNTSKFKICRALRTDR